MKKNNWIWIIAIIAIIAIIYFNIDLAPQTTLSIPQCQQDLDCPQTIKNDCEGFFVGCLNNQCIYDQTNVVCMNELVTILLQQQQLEEPKIEPIGSKTFIFNARYKTDSFNFGVKPFSTDLDFICSAEEGQTLRFPQPNANCYTAKASFDSKTYNLAENQEIYLNNHIKFRYNGGGSVYGKKTYVSKVGLSAQFLFTLTDPIEISLNDNQEVLHNSNKIFNLNVKNNLPEGSFYVKISNIAKQTNEILPEKYMTQALSEGFGTLSFGADTENYGIHELEARIFYKLTVNDDEILLPLSQVFFKYNVVDELSGNSGSVIIEEEDIPQENEDNKTILIVLGVIIGFIILSRLL